jgi:hypothetical protein
MTKSAQDPPWLALEDVCHMYGCGLRSALQAIRAERFPVPTYKIGRRVVIDKDVHAEFFKRKKEAGLAALSST